MAALANRMVAASGVPNLGVHLGLRCGAMERVASMNLADYSYPDPTPAHQAVLTQQAALLTAPQHPYQQEPAALPVVPAASAGVTPSFSHLPLSATALLPAPGPSTGQVGAQPPSDDFLDSMLPLDLDDDCLKLMFGEDGDESSKAGVERMITRSTAAAKACVEQPEDDDAVDLLFQDLSTLRHVASYGDLDLDVLQALQQDFDTASSGSEGAAKRTKHEQPHLMLTMNYATAAQTINSLIDADRKVPASSPSGSLGAPPSPDSLASAGTYELESSNRMGKRKREV